jgi:hypothetical protein
VKIRYTILIFILGFTSSCSNEFNSESDLYQWLGDKENGVLKERTHEEIKYSLKILPNDLTIYNDLEGEEYRPSKIDSIRETKKDELACLLLIDIKKGTQDNPLFTGITEYKDYKERIQDLNFHFSDFFHAQIGDQVITPKIWVFEDLYTLGNKRKVMIVFSERDLDKSISESMDIDFVFNDQIFGTGINHFKIKTEDILSIPEIGFWKYKSI